MCETVFVERRIKAELTEVENEIVCVLERVLSEMRPFTLHSIGRNRAHKCAREEQ